MSEEKNPVDEQEKTQDGGQDTDDGGTKAEDKNTEKTDDGTSEDSHTLYQTDIINVNNAIQAIEQESSASNAVKEELEGFLQELLDYPDEPITNDTIIETVTSTGIYNYLNGISFAPVSDDETDEESEVE